ncbi:ABC-2 family transporter protein [Candidatus Daviesbacteria bacterium]|nr:ABC-2 family transporter protein [Candidatus Daviesbacteria bacterium]
MKKYFSIYKTLFILNWSIFTGYRANFLNSIFSSLLWGVFQIITIFVLTAKTSSAFGWTRTELFILISSFNIFIGFYHGIFSNNFERFSEIIHFGQLDGILLKPMDSQFILSLNHINFASFFRILLGIGFLEYLILQNHLQINLIQIISFGTLLLIGLILLYSIWFCVMTLTMWFTKLSNLVELMYTFNGITRYPKEMYQGLKGFLFIVILPLSLIVSAPTKILLQRTNFLDILELLIFTLVFFIISRKFWKFALRFYTSASS